MYKNLWTTARYTYIQTVSVEEVVFIFGAMTLVHRKMTKITQLILSYQIQNFSSSMHVAMYIGS